MVDIKDLSFSYGADTALKDISLHINKNATCAIIGPSGCGKTTLLYLLAGLLHTNQGEIEIR